MLANINERRQDVICRLVGFSTTTVIVVSFVDWTATQGKFVWRREVRTPYVYFGLSFTLYRTDLVDLMLITWYLP